MMGDLRRAFAWLAWTSISDEYFRFKYPASTADRKSDAKSIRRPSHRTRRLLVARREGSGCGPECGLRTGNANDSHYYARRSATKELTTAFCVHASSRVQP